MTWSCEYCRAANSDDDLRCWYCGAPRRTSEADDSDMWEPDEDAIKRILL